MKKTIRLSLIAASVLALTACNQEAKKEHKKIQKRTILTFKERYIITNI